MKTPIELRSPDDVMRLDRLGAAHPTRLSFLRAMMRQAMREDWAFSVPLWVMSKEGYGHALLTIDTGRHRYSLVCFSTPLADEDRTDRVIATAWDTSYVLYDGIPDAAEIARLAANAPRQEAGRFGPKDLVLARANKSVRLFDHVVKRLAQGQQPDASLIESVGYLMRTTAVYGNGKFGIADRDSFHDRPEFQGPFRAEMLTVWLIRAFTIRLAEDMARQQSPQKAVPLAPDLRQALGVGNSTGLGMAPFLVRHPLLIHRWFSARETALARVRACETASAAQCAAFASALTLMRDNVRRWHTDDPVQAPRVDVLQGELDTLQTLWPTVLQGTTPWNNLFLHAQQHFSLEGQEASIALMLEPNGDLIDDLANSMAAEEDETLRLDGSLACGHIKTLIQTHYDWIKRHDFTQDDQNARFWYVSEEKLEPRLGERYAEAGAERELPLAIARDITALQEALAEVDPTTSLGAFLLVCPQWRHMVRRVLLVAQYPYAEIRDNLLGATMRPVDLLRAKLAFFGASRFDPRSDRWLRISLFANMPHPDEVLAESRTRGAA